MLRDGSRSDNSPRADYKKDNLRRFEWLLAKKRCSIFWIYFNLKALGGTDKSGVDLRRLLKGTIRNVSGPRGSRMENDYDKIEANPKDIFAFWQWLQAKGFIVLINLENPDRFELTIEGKRFHERLTKGHGQVPCLDLDCVVFDEELLEDVEDLLQRGKYHTAIREATLLLEERMRAKAELPKEVYGSKLATKTIHPKEGKLKIPPFEDKNEWKGIFQLYDGTMAFIRNIPNHYTTDFFDDPTNALQIIIFIDSLLRLLGQTEPKGNQASP
jgi:hypothetical protein